MIERVVYERVVEYLANALWQLPLLAAGAWCLLRAARLGPLGQHRLWVAVLGLGVMLPLARVAPQRVVVRSAGPALSGMEVSGGEARLVSAESVGESADGSGWSWLREAMRRRNVEVSAGTARGPAGMYLVVMLLGLVRLVRSLKAAQGLVARASDVSVTERWGLLLEECGRRIGVGVPRVVESSEVSSPAVVGSVLVVPAALVGYTEDEVRAALLHELAHLRRRDYGANVLFEMAALPVVWHPVSYAVRRRIRSTREMVCDEIAATAMGSVYVYALSLVELAAKTCVGNVEAQPMAVGLFTNNNLEERVMRLIETKEPMDVRASVIRVVSAAAGMLGVVVLAAMVHVTPARAQAAAGGTSQAAAAQDQPQAVPAPPPIAGVPAPPAVSAIPGPPSLPGLPAVPGAPAVPALPTLPPLPAAPAPPSVPAPAPAPAPMPAPSPSAIVRDRTQMVPDRTQIIPIVPDGVQIVPDGAQVVPDGAHSAEEPVAMAHGAKARIEPEDGAFLHEWKAGDGQPFKILNHQQAEPSAAQKKRYEELYRREMADMDKELAELKMSGPKLEQTMADAQREATKARKLVQSPEFQRQIAELDSPAFQKQMADQMASLKLQLEVSKQARFESLKQMRELDNAELQKSMADLRKQLDEGRLAGFNVRVTLKQLDSEGMKRQMADLDRQLQNLTSKEVQKQVEEQMKAAQKQLDEAQKLMETERLREKPDSVPTCTGDCATAPH